MLKSFSILFSLLVITILALFVFPFYNPDGKDMNSNSKLTISVTIYPTYDIVKNIVGDKISLRQIIPFGREPHSFEPTPQDIMNISNSQLFIHTGSHVDSWANEMANVSRGDRFLKLVDFVEVVNEDPHFWLSSQNFQSMVKNIGEKIIKIDKVNEEFYRQNIKNYLEKITKLDSDFKSRLKSCKLNSIIVNHNAFRYLGRDYNFQSFPIMGISPDDRPSAKALAEIINIVKDRNISTIFFEELASSKVIETIASETGISVSSLSPLGNVSPKKVDIGYINLMYSNLNKLEEAMVCQ